MHLHLHAFAQEVEGFNERSLTLEDFYKECSERDIRILELPFSELLGATQTVEGITYIGLSTQLDEASKTLTSFHELGHSILHCTEHEALRSLGGFANKPKWEREADAVALVALIPQCDIWRYDEGDLCDKYAVSRELIDRRLMLWGRFGF